MSTIDSQLNYGAQTIINDVYRPLFGDPGPKKSLLYGKLFMIVMLLTAIIITYKSSSLMGIAVKMAGIFGSTAVLGWGLWWWWRVNLWSWISAFIMGPIMYFGLGFLLEYWDWWQAKIASGESAAQSMGMLQAIIAMVVTTIIWVAVTLYTKPSDMKVLKKFYLKVKPVGCWGPVIKALEKEDGIKIEPHKNVILGGILTSFLGSAWITLAVLSISVLFVGRYVEALVMGVAALVLALGFKKAFSYHLDKMEV